MLNRQITKKREGPINLEALLTNWLEVSRNCVSQRMKYELVLATDICVVCVSVWLILAFVSLSLFMA